MSGRKRRSLLGNAPADGSPESASPPDPVAAPEPPEEPAPPPLVVETESPPPVSSKSRRRLLKSSGEYTDERTGETGRRATSDPEPFGEAPSLPPAVAARPEQPADPLSGLVSFEEPPAPAEQPVPARRAPSRDPDLAYRRPSLDPEPARRTATGEPDPEPRGKPEKSRSPFGELKVVEKAAAKRAAGSSPFFRSAPPEDAGVYESNAPVGPSRRSTLPQETPAFERVPEPQKVPKKPATRGAPDTPDFRRPRVRAEKTEPDKVGGHKEPLSWNQVAPNHVWDKSTSETDTPAPPPMKRAPVAERPPLASVDVVPPKKAQVEKAPLESIEMRATPSLPGLFDGSTPEPVQRIPTADPARPDRPAAKPTPTPSPVPPPPKPVVKTVTEDDEGRQAGCLPTSTILALLLIPLSIILTALAAVAVISPRGAAPQVPEKPHQVIPAAPRIPLPSEVPPPPVEDTMPEAPVPVPGSVPGPVPGVTAPKPKPKPAQPKPSVIGVPVTEDRGVVKVRANKHGLIHVNGVAKSFTPDQLSLPPGTYQITVTVPDGPSLTQTVTVRKDKTEPLEFTFP
jgi:hypothetical protein